MRVLGGLGIVVDGDREVPDVLEELGSEVVLVLWKGLMTSAVSGLDGLLTASAYDFLFGESLLRASGEVWFGEGSWIRVSRRGTGKVKSLSSPPREANGDTPPREV